MSPLLSLLTLRGFSRRSFAARCLCDCQDAARCRCAAQCRCHLGATTRALLDVALVPRTARRPLPTFMLVPRGPLLWGSNKPQTVLCQKCGSIIRPGAVREVRMLGPGRWEHVECRTGARVPRGGRRLESLLRASLIFPPRPQLTARQLAEELSYETPEMAGYRDE